MYNTSDGSSSSQIHPCPARNKKKNNNSKNPTGISRLQSLYQTELIRMNRFFFFLRKGHLTLSLVVLYDVSENNWKGSMDIWHVNKAVSNYGGLSAFKAEQTLGCPWMCAGPASLHRLPIWRLWGGWAAWLSRLPWITSVHKVLQGFFFFLLGFSLRLKMWILGGCAVSWVLLLCTGDRTTRGWKANRGESTSHLWPRG